MPYKWTHTPEARALTLWPHQSLTPRGFTWFIGITAVMLALPLLAVLGSPVVWFLLAFFTAALAGVWRAITANVKDRTRHEALHLGETRVRLEHVQPKGEVLTWEANPHWVTVHLRDDGPVEKYLTLRGNSREVEIGSFLSREERETLFDEISQALKN